MNDLIDLFADIIEGDGLAIKVARRGVPRLALRSKGVDARHVAITDRDSGDTSGD